MRVRWNKRALMQLQAAYDLIEKDNPAAAHGFLDAVTALVDSFAQFPGMGMRTDEPGVSMLPLVRYRYLIYYKAMPSGEIRIIRIRHASRKRLS